MRKIEVDNTRFFYLVPNENPALDAVFPHGVDPPSEPALARVGSARDVRLLAFESFFEKGRGLIYFGFWPDNPDLRVLDRRVIDGTYTQEDFERFVKTAYQETRCDRCGRTWPSLVIPPGDPYPGAPGLLERKIAQSRFLLCPSCGAMLRQMVVRLLLE